MVYDIGAMTKFDLNFQYKIQQQDENNYLGYPLIIAIAKGSSQMVDYLLLNKTANINECEPETGINSVWLACYYGHSKIMK